MFLDLSVPRVCGYSSSGSRVLSLAPSDRQLRAATGWADAMRPGDVIGCLVRPQSGAIEFFRNGVSQGIAFTIPTNQILYPMVCV